jgi:hypothetical protein
MINKDDFLDLVYSSVNYTTDGVPYLTIEDKSMVCPFCQNPLHMKKNVIECDCDESKEFAENFLSNCKELENYKKQISVMQDDVKRRSLGFFKKYFRDIIEPQLQKEYKKQIGDILSL